MENKNQMLNVRVLNIINDFVRSYNFSDGIYSLIDSVLYYNGEFPRKSTEEIKDAIEHILSAILREIGDALNYDDEESDEKYEQLFNDATRGKQLFNVAIEKINSCENIETDCVEEVKNFLEAEKVIIKKYTDLKKGKISRQFQRISTMFGKTKDVIRVNGKKMAIGGAVGTVVIGGIIILASLGGNGDKKSNNSDNNSGISTRPGVTATASPTATPTPKATSTPMPTEEPIADNSIESEIGDKSIEDKVKEASDIVYNSWCKITNSYSISDIENVIWVLNGLESSITIDDATDIIEDILAQVTIPRVNNILVKTPYAKKTVDVASLLINADENAISIQRLLNEELTSDDLKANAEKALKEEVMAYNCGLLDNSSAGARIVWAKIVTFLNAINGTLGNITIEYNDEYYCQNDVLDSSFVEDIVARAKAEISGKIF